MIYSNAKAVALLRDLGSKLQNRFANGTGLNTVSNGFYVDANGASWPYLMVYNAAAGLAAGKPVLYIEIAEVQSPSPDIFGNILYGYAPHKLLFGYELGVANAYTYTVTSANATAGAVYTNNGNSFIVNSTIAGGTTLVATGTAFGTPLASGTLTKASGTGDATITFSAFTFSGTTSTNIPHADLLASEFESIKTGVAFTLVELPNGTAVTGASVNAATPVTTVDELYWPTKLV